jgi:hypothetical protein
LLRARLVLNLVMKLGEPTLDERVARAIYYARYDA